MTAEVKEKTDMKEKAEVKEKVEVKEKADAKEKIEVKAKPEAKEKAERKMVLPGDLVTEERRKLGEHVFLHEGKIFSDVVGFVEDSTQSVSVIPLKGKYIPVLGDSLIGVVCGEKFYGYEIALDSFYSGVIPKKELNQDLAIGSVVSAKVQKISDSNEVELSYPRQFFSGELFSISATKVPRLIGKNASMIDAIKKGTNCMIVVGRNGLVWAKGDNIKIVEKTIIKIEKEALTSNLTNRIIEFIEEEKKKIKKEVSEP